ncbi:hypothetical protein OEB99_10810 [Actinotalea sp. M2MS4P-6]|uniref:hypothetical protein n=1 Tax=Actinotalea sp. M2MS4P-6 TaxID=2983762 RepID=UPI0021E50EE6|nr:hypothetical protein [Actinotalea sp. M2MS4P-6]MCV2394799.1 hypothetical protein [Actinotalea sp. M2MS4P-6]
MVTVDEIRTLAGTEVVDHSGAAMGTAADVYVDDWTGNAAWVVVHGSTDDRLAPLSGSWVHDAVLELDVPVELVRDAPALTAQDTIAPDDEARLVEHYGSALSPSGGPGVSGEHPRSAHRSSPTTGPGASGHLPSTVEAASPTTGPGGPGRSTDLPITEPRRSPRTGVGGTGEPGKTHLRRWEPTG